MAFFILCSQSLSAMVGGWLSGWMIISGWVCWSFLCGGPSYFDVPDIFYCGHSTVLYTWNESTFRPIPVFFNSYDENTFNAYLQFLK